MARRSCCAPISPRSSCSSWARTSASARRSTARSPPAPGDPVILLNNDVVCEPRFVEALLEPAAAGAEMVAGVLLTERDPRFVDSAGVDRRPHPDGLRLPQRRAASRGVEARFRPARPDRRRGALLAAPRSRPSAASTSASSSTTRTSTWPCGWSPAGVRCELAPDAAAVHAYSARPRRAASGAKYARTGWSAATCCAATG